jgi:hypothetical protein
MFVCRKKEENGRLNDEILRMLFTTVHSAVSLSTTKNQPRHKYTYYYLDSYGVHPVACV